MHRPMYHRVRRIGIHDIAPLLPGAQFVYSSAMSLITETDALASFCERLSHSEFVTVDTEFIRDKTYWPILCLVQLAGEDEFAAVDTLADGIDLTPLLDLMRDRSVLKVFHAARQDFEIFHQLMGMVPQPVFDTQVSAMVCGFGDQVGYETIVAKLARERIDKSMRFTDWQRRPLSAKQLEYALADVTHLRVVYQKLQEILAKNGRAEWVAEEMTSLTSDDLYRFDPREAWQRVKSRNPKRRFLGILREVAAWREEEAQKRDVPRNRIIRDDALLEIAAHRPASQDDLANLRGLNNGQAQGSFGRGILEAVAKGVALPDAECPEVTESRQPSTPVGPSVDLLKVLVKLKSEEHDVAQRLIANSADIEAIAADDDADVAALRGWRREMFGEAALALKHGRLALTADGAKIKLVSL
jgi:ribonuclease D